MANDIEKLPEVLPVEVKPVQKRPIRLRSARDARKFLGRLANWTMQGRIDGTVAAKIAYILSIWIKSHESTELEDQIAELESRLGIKDE